MIQAAPHRAFFYDSLISGIWLAWVLYWFIAARGAKPALRRESSLSRLSHMLPLAIGVLLILAQRVPWTWLTIRLYPPSLTIYWIGVACLCMGLAFTVWARLHLGRNWSSSVTLKEQHELIRTGPYRIVRHPIYTGLMFAILGCAMARGELRAIIGLAIALASLIRKLRIEERLMREQFGKDYERYSAEVPALVPRFW